MTHCGVNVTVHAEHEVHRLRTTRSRFIHSPTTTLYPSLFRGSANDSPEFRPQVVHRAVWQSTDPRRHDVRAPQVPGGDPGTPLPETGERRRRPGEEAPRARGLAERPRGRGRRCPRPGADHPPPPRGPPPRRTGPGPGHRRRRRAAGGRPQAPPVAGGPRDRARAGQRLCRLHRRSWRDPGDPPCRPGRGPGGGGRVVGLAVGADPAGCRPRPGPVGRGSGTRRSGSARWTRWPNA